MTKPYSAPTDVEIIAAIKSGDIDLFRVLRDRYDGYIKFIVEKAIRNRASSAARGDVSRGADDLSAEIIFKIYEGLDGFDASRASFKTWLTRVAENHMTDWLMRSRLDIDPLERAAPDDGESFEIPCAADGPSPERRYLASVITDDILTAMRSMENPLLKSHLIFKFLFAMEDSEIARALDTAESTVRANMWRALKEFEERFKGLKDAYADADMSEIALFIKRDAVEIPDELTADGCGTATERLRQTLEESIAVRAAKKPSRKLLNDLAGDALAEVLAAMKRRAGGVMKINDKPVSDAAALALSRYIDAALSGASAPETRGPDDASLSRLKQDAEALAAALARLGVRKHPRASLGSAILEKVRERNINLDEAAKTLKLDAIALSALINDSPDDKTRRDSKLAARLAAFTGLSKSEVKTLLETASPPSALTSPTRSRAVSSVGDLDRRILKTLEEKYGRKK